MKTKALKGEAIKEAEAILKKVDETQHFVVLKETFYKNPNLTGDEIALFVYLLTRAPNYKPKSHYLKKALKMGDDRFFRASKGLQNKGYLIIDFNGKNGARYTISQTPTGNAYAWDTPEQTILFNNPNHLIELYEKGNLDKAHLVKRLRDFISAVATKTDLTKDEYKTLLEGMPKETEQEKQEQIKLAREKWLDD